jgi:hypothetical protein
MQQTFRQLLLEVSSDILCLSPQQLCISCREQPSESGRVKLDFELNGPGAHHVGTARTSPPEHAPTLRHPGQAAKPRQAGTHWPEHYRARPSPRLDALRRGPRSSRHPAALLNGSRVCPRSARLPGMTRFLRRHHHSVSICQECFPAFHPHPPLMPSYFIPAACWWERVCTTFIQASVAPRMMSQECRWGALRPRVRIERPRSVFQTIGTERWAERARGENAGGAWQRVNLKLD